MFYKTGIDITNDKQMFNFLKNHFGYYTLNPWNNLKSIANNVKLHSLNLSGDWTVAMELLNNGEYDTINCDIMIWCEEHPGYNVYLNGRSCGYLVLCDSHNNSHVLPDCITECDTYDEYKEYCREYYGSVKANRDTLVEFTKLVQDFDKLCDTLRNYCDDLSNLSFEVVTMERVVEEFNSTYDDDLYFLDFRPLHCLGDGKVDVSEIKNLQCLWEAFTRIANREDSGYVLIVDDGYAEYVKA